MYKAFRETQLAKLKALVEGHDAAKEGEVLPATENVFKTANTQSSDGKALNLTDRFPADCSHGNMKIAVILISAQFKQLCYHLPRS